jgi:hypothetical protein
MTLSTTGLCGIWSTASSPPRCCFHRFRIALVLLAVSNVAGAIPFTFDARTLGMGGTSTATATLANAAWANPSMLTRQPLKDDFALLIGVGAFVRDDEGLIGDVEDFQDADDRYQDAIDAGDVGGIKSALGDMNSLINGIDGKIIAPEASVLLAVGIAFDSFSMAISARTDLIAGGTVTDLSCDVTQPGCDRTEILSEDFNIMNIEGVQATEIGVSFARDFELDGHRVSVGIKPKLVQLRAFIFRESILTFNEGGEDILDTDNKKDLGSLATVDLGFAYDLTDSVILGLNIRNLIGNRYELDDQTLNFDTEWEVGVAYNNSFMTLAMDYDLSINSPLLANEAFTALDRQDLKVGAEFRAGRYVMLRLGAFKNLAPGIPDGAQEIRYTAGIGLWLGFKLDIAAVVNDNTIGGMVQTGFSF